MGLSILHNLLDLRSKLFNSIDLQDKALTTLTGVAELSECFSGTIADGVGNILKVESDTVNDVISIIRIANDGISDNTTMFNGSIETLRNAWDGISIPSEYVSTLYELKNFSCDASQAQACNEVITTMIEKYTTNTKAKASDLSAILSASSLSNSDASRFIGAINSASDSDGYLSNYAFLGVIKSFLDSGKDSLEKGGITLDESSPVYLSHFLGTAFLSILASLASFIGSCLQWIHLLVGTIISALGWIAETVLSQLAGVGSTDIKIKDPTASTFWFEAPSIGLTYNWTSSPNYRVNTDKISSTASTYRDTDGYALLYWLDSSDNRNLLINEYPSIMFDIDLMRDWVDEHVKFIAVNPSGTSDFRFTFAIDVNLDHRDYFSFMDQFLLNEDRLKTVLSSSNEDLADYFFEQMELVSVLNVVRSSRGYPYSDTWHNLWEVYFKGIRASGTLINPEVDWSSHFDGVINEIVMNGDPAALNLAWATKYMLELRGSQGRGSDYEWYSSYRWYNASKRASYFTQAMIARKTQMETFDILGYITSYSLAAAGNGIFEMSSIASSADTVRAYRHALGQIFMVSTSYDPVSGSYYAVLNHLMNTDDDATRESALSSIPESRMFSYANADLADVITALILIGSVFTVTLCVGSVCAKAIKKHSWKKQYTKKREVKAAAAAYEANPTAANLDALYKKQKSYNFKAKLFGWDSFDASNMWFNESGNASSGSNSMDLTSLRKLIKN